MNLEESDSFKSKIEKKARKRKVLIFGIVLCLILIVLMMFMIGLIKYQDDHTNKMFVNGQKLNKISTTLYKDIGSDVYVNAKEFSELINNIYNVGDYDKFNQNDKSAYIDNGFEIITISAEEGNNTKFRKYYQNTNKEQLLGKIQVNVKVSDNEFETFKTKKPFVYDEKNGIYVSLEDLQEVFNVKVSWKEFRKEIRTLDYIAQKAMAKVANSKKYNDYTVLSNDYENIKALLDGIVILSNAKPDNKSQDALYGAYDLESGKEIIGNKYSDIDYMQSSKDFFVTITNQKDKDKKVGILSNDGKQLIAPAEFDDIKVLDFDKKLYLVQSDGLYGVCDSKGQILVYAEYEKIGLDVKDFPKDNIENPSLIFDKCIPVFQNDGTTSKYGLYNIKGQEILSINYDRFGYVESDKKTNNKINNTLIIPEEVGIRGIVFQLDGLYGIFDVDREKIVLPASQNKIYNIVKDGKKTYYMESDGVLADLKLFLEEKGLDNKDLKKKEKVEAATTESLETT